MSRSIIQTVIIDRTIWILKGFHYLLNAILYWTLFWSLCRPLHCNKLGRTYSFNYDLCSRDDTPDTKMGLAILLAWLLNANISNVDRDIQKARRRISKNCHGTTHQYTSLKQIWPRPRYVKSFNLKVYWASKNSLGKSIFREASIARSGFFFDRARKTQGRKNS